jgi:16S rRNA G527 N7-methylase RsmG
MFHVEHRRESFDTIEKWLGFEIAPTQRLQLDRFERWLEEEALPARGIGPAEGERLFDRHILDSLAFLRGFSGGARTVVDVGGGVGLPSIPLAITRPDLAFTLVDRSSRRTDLAARAGRILGLGNFCVVTQDVDTLEPAHDIAVFRASLSIVQAAKVLPRCVGSTGTGLFAVSRQHDRPSLPSAPEGITFALSREGDTVLASPFWLLEMRLSRRA